MESVRRLGSGVVWAAVATTSLAGHIGNRCRATKSAFDEDCLCQQHVRRRNVATPLNLHFKHDLIHTTMKAFAISIMLALAGAQVWPASTMNGGIPVAQAPLPTAAPAHPPHLLQRQSDDATSLCGYVSGNGCKVPRPNP